MVLLTTCNLIKDTDRGLPYLRSKAGVANLFLQVSKMQDPQNVHRVKIRFKETLTDQIFSSFKAYSTQLTCINICLSGRLRKSARAISKALAGQKWPAGLALTTPDLKQQLLKNKEFERMIYYIVPSFCMSCRNTVL